MRAEARGRTTTKATNDREKNDAALATPRRHAVPRRGDHVNLAEPARFPQIRLRLLRHAGRTAAGLWPDALARRRAASRGREASRRIRSRHLSGTWAIGRPKLQAADPRPQGADG